MERTSASLALEAVTPAGASLGDSAGAAAEAAAAALEAVAAARAGVRLKKPSLVIGQLRTPNPKKQGLTDGRAWGSQKSDEN